MHTIWKGSISFGLVNIPIRLHSATEDKDISLRTLHKECHTPIKYEKVCPVCNKQVEKEELVKAYEYTKGKFVVVDDKELEELKKANETKAVEIVDFVKIEEIDPIYFMKSYYLSPNEGGVKAYTLLRKALQESQKVGIAKIVIRSKEQLAVVRVFENTLLMETIYFPDEVRSAGDVPNVPAEEDISKRELDTAIMLIDQLTTEFEPGKYHDAYRTALMELIESKKNGKTVTPKERDVPESNVMDLMAALQASIDKTKGPAKKPAAKKKRAAPAKEKKKA
ncbi:DNA end-binding protein Ku [Peribacillus deserti]|uniref:Non-homologous end joining protein Ku n=1 Tax=Peribacillus deserti TaxID=673318 RepID=A0ABS2QH78_9BACI|nr:Ku protein [Peribacillus deserti]MBM7692497.1 DNA end-binding protein Ku [Peribacillus deserti]